MLQLLSIAAGTFQELIRQTWQLNATEPRPARALRSAGGQEFPLEKPNDVERFDRGTSGW